LAYLVLNPGVQHPREKVAGILWPDSDRENALNSLRHALWRLRKSIGERHILTDKVSIAFDRSSDYTLDVDILKDKAPLTGSADDLINAISVYDGELLPGFYGAWVTLDRERTHAVFNDRMRMLTDRLMETGRWWEVLT
jgi:DNA-binding SARP family transcriptional activator